MERIVVIGAGQAASTLIVKLRGLGFAGEILLIGDEPHLPYQRPPLSKKYLAGEMPRERLLLRQASWYEKNAVTLKLGVSAKELIERLDRISSHYANHHGVDLLLELRGQLPADKANLLAIVDRFLRLDENDKMNFILGRRLGVYRRLKDMDDLRLHRLVDRKRKDFGYSSRTDWERLFHSLRAQVV